MALRSKQACHAAWLASRAVMSTAGPLLAVPSRLRQLGQEWGSANGEYLRALGSNASRPESLSDDTLSWCLGLEYLSLIFRQISFFDISHLFHVNV